MSKKNVPHYEQPEEQQAYYKSLVKLLDHYEDGWNLFINAHKERNYDYPLVRKPEFENDPYLPKTWLQLTDEVCRIIAVEKYELDILPNTIEIIRADQMLDAYTTTGLPDSYRHWSFGKRRTVEEMKYDANKHLAYEIVINSDPCIAYCMDTNSPLLQLLVIAHASYGHNTVFKNNYLFRDFTDTANILTDNIRMRDYVAECEKKYGWENVSRLLDFCHALQFVDSADVVKKDRPSSAELAKRRKEQILNHHLNGPRQSVFNISANDNAAGASAGRSSPYQGEKNILGFMADHAPHMPEWKRNIMRMRSRLSQYFKPQMMTKVLNEGMATFTHDKTLTTMRDIGLIDWAMYQEYTEINNGVLYQQGAIRTVDVGGQKIDILIEVPMNPYTLGLKILREIERICKNPTPEDRKWFPHFAGDPDWLAMVKHAVFSSNDETFIHQYLSPQAMRDLKLFSVKDLPGQEVAQATAITADEGFRKIRDRLSQDYRLHELLPDISLHDYQEKTDRCLILRHNIFENKALDAKDAKMIIEMMHAEWEHPIVIESVIPETGEVKATYSSPPNYNYKMFKRIDPDQNYNI